MTGRAYSAHSDEIDFGAGWAAAEMREWRTAPAAPESRWSEWSRTVDHSTILACLVLFAIGVVLAFAASPALAERTKNPEPFYFAWRHLSYGAPAFGALLVCSFFNIATVRRLGAILALCAFAAMALLPYFGADHGKAAQRWLSIAGQSVQPSEFLKPGLIVVCGWMLSALGHKERGVAAGGAAAAFALLAIAVGLLALQPDIGQAALIIAVWGVMFFVAGGSLFVIAALGVAAGGLLSAAYYLTPHIAPRIDAFLAGGGGGQTQLLDAERAILNGGWFGRGLGEGVAKNKLPDAHSDFILAVAIEEYGFVLAAAIVALFLFITLRALWRLRGVSDGFAYVAGTGLALLVGLQAFIHIAVSAQLAPTTGMTLPFVSYGGSSLVATGASIGLLLALSRSGRAAP